jgi:serine/threonine protein kinase
MINSILSNKYKLIEKISEGTFGIVFKAENIRTNEYVAIKIEPKSNVISSLKNEAKILHYLQNEDGFPQLKMFGSNDTINFIVYDLLGPSLQKRVFFYKALCLKTTLLIGIQMIKLIETLHNTHLIHRDIKPNNFIFGLGSQTNKIFLIDFGFCKRFNYDGKHIDETKINKIIGTPYFVSLNVHNNIEPSRRDDLESIIYILLFMLFGRLEWFYKDKLEDIYQLKKYIVFVEDVPSFLKICLYYIRELRFDEKPDYDYIINLLVKKFNENNFKDNNKFEWCNTN